MFAELDSNGDKSLQKDEFMAHAGVDRFTLTDRDKDGFISLPEYLHHDDNFFHTEADAEEASFKNRYNRVSPV